MNTVINWTDNPIGEAEDDKINDFLEARSEVETQRVGKSDIKEGLAVDVTASTLCGGDQFTLVNAKVTRARRLGDELPDFQVETDDFRATVYCDRAHWKISVAEKVTDGQNERIGTFECTSVKTLTHRVEK